MPPMKNQPLVSQAYNESLIRNTDAAKPVLKSRLKRLFDRQFPSVLRNNSSAAAEFKPSSVCLAKMVQNFIEESQDSKSAAKCGRNRCNCFNGNINDSSDDEFDVSSGFNESSTSPSAVDSLEMLKSLIPCASVDERNLLAQTSKIVEKNKIFKKKDDLRKIVTDSLLLLGYDASICKSCWEKSPGPSFPAGEYEYIDVISEGERVIIDVDFRSEFEIARPTGGYKLILQSLPLIFVGRSDRLQLIVSIASEAANQSLNKKGMHVPPWRKVQYMRAKWLSSHTRTNSLHSAFKFGNGLLSSCGDERIIKSTTNHGDQHDAALLPLVNMDTYVHMSSTQPVALPDGGEIVQLESSEKKPRVDFDATNSRAPQSGVLVSNSENQNMREASKRWCMTESVLSIADSKTRISLKDYDPPDNRSHLLRAHQSGPIVFNSEKKDWREELHRECFTKSALSLDDSTKQKVLLDFDVTENKAHLFRAYQSGPVVSLSENKSRGEALKRECITKNILGIEDLQQHCGDRCDDAAKTFGAIYDSGFHKPDSLAWKSFEELETLPTEEQPIDYVPLLAQGKLTLEGCVQQEISQELPRVMQINGVEQRVTKMPRYLGGLTAQSASSSRWPICLPDGGHIMLLDPLDQSTENIEHVARVDQCYPTVFLAEKKMLRKTLKRECRTISVIFEENHQHFGRRCAGAAKSLGAMRICRKHGINQVCTLKPIHKQHGIHQWPFRQKWATRKGYYLGEERPFEVRRLSMDEKLDSRLQLIHMSQFARSSPQALALPDGGEIVRPTVLSSSEFAAMNNRAHLVGQDQSGSTASHYKCKNTRDTSDKQGLEDLQQHFGCKHKHALKSLGVSGSMFKSTCKQHWFYWWLGQFENNEQQAFDATSNRAHLVKADERGPTVSNALSLEDLRHQFGARCKESAKGLRDSLAWKSFKVLDSLPLVEQSNTRRRSLTHKHCVRLKKSQDLPRSVLRGCSGGLTAQSDIGLPDGGHILSFSEKKIVRKTLKRKCRTTSVLSLEDHQQHVGRRWEDTVKFLGVKRISRQLVIQRETIAKCIRRQLGTRRWLFKQSAIGFPDGGHILSLSENKIVRKTLKSKCRNTSVLSLEDHKQHVDRWWEDAAKSHGAKRICRQLGIHRLSIAKRTHKQHGIHQWPFQQSAIGSPDGRHVLPLSEKKW